MKMLVTQALDERDLLVKKIRDKIAKASFIDVKKRNEVTVLNSRVELDQFEKQALASFQQIGDLIDNYTRIDAAIIASNANTWIETSYGRFTVAAAIALRSRLDEKGSYADEGTFEENLCCKMLREYEACVQEAERRNRQLEDAAERMRLGILGKENRTKDRKSMDLVDAYVYENTSELIDPLGIRKKAEDIEERNRKLLSELKTQIKVSNATTMIEV